MYCKLALAVVAVIIGNDFATAEQIPSTTTAAELWNPWTWFWPYAIATAEGYRDYYQKAQKATNELYQQIYKTNAFPWVTGNWGPQTQPNQNGGQSNQGQSSGGGTGGQSNQEGQNTGGGTGGQTNQNGGQSNQGGQNTGGGTGDQTNQTQNSETDPQTPPKEEQNTPTEEKPEENQTQAEGTGAQVQGNVQDDGTAEAEVKPN